MTEMTEAHANPTGMTQRAPLNRVDHATVRVDDLDAAVAWYRAALDLDVVHADTRRAALTVGGDGRVDLVLTAGGTGCTSVALGIDSPDELERVANDLAERGVTFRRVESDLPGIDAVLEVPSPGGPVIQIVASASGPTGACNPGRSNGIAPVDTDHTTILVQDVRGYARWLAETFGFATSDAVAAPGHADAWISAWTHITPQHHDIALIATDDPVFTLHHNAFRAADLNHMGEVADRVCSLTEEGRCEWGIGKHGGLGANNYLYFKDPSGNRVEFNSGMESNPFDRPTDVYPGEDFGKFISIWDFEPPPATFMQGS